MNLIIFAAGVLGSVAVLAALAFLVVYLVKRRARRVADKDGI